MTHKTNSDNIRVWSYGKFTDAKRGSGGMLCQKILKIMCLRLTKNAFAALENEVSIRQCRPIKVPGRQIFADLWIQPK
jgi:hypothetical protein